MSNSDLFNMTNISSLHRCLLSYSNKHEKESLDSKSLRSKARCARADRGGRSDQGLTHVVVAGDGVVGADTDVTGQQPLVEKGSSVPVGKGLLSRLLNRD